MRSLSGAKQGAGQPGGHRRKRPPKRCRCRCSTVCPPHAPSLSTTRYPSRSAGSIFATRLAVYNSSPRMWRWRSCAEDRPVSPSLALGTITMCTGACGALSWNARTSSSSYTRSAGSFRVMILSKTVSVAVAVAGSVIMDARRIRCASETASASTSAACTAALRSWGSCSSEAWASFNCAVMTRSLDSGCSAFLAACRVASTAMGMSALGAGSNAAAVGSRMLVEGLAARACSVSCNATAFNSYIRSSCSLAAKGAVLNEESGKGFEEVVAGRCQGRGILPVSSYGHLHFLFMISCSKQTSVRHTFPWNAWYSRPFVENSTPIFL